MPLDNLPCCSITCPITEPQNIGPYHHNGILGDQNQPYFKGSNPPPAVLMAYERMLRGTSTEEEDEMVRGFWVWHVPPFLSRFATWLQSR